jgi:hypothetical protein
VTAPITPDNRTTGTTAPRCHRLGTSFISAAFIRPLMAFPSAIRHHPIA